MEEQKLKITDEQLQESQTKVSQVLNQIGFLEIQKSALKVEFNKVNDEAEEVKKKLEEEYGPININLSSGEYTVVEVKEEE